MTMHWYHYAACVGAGVMGVAMALTVWHLWVDHAAIHQVIDYLNRVATAQAGR